MSLSAEEIRLFEAVERNAAAAVQQAIRDGANANAVRHRLTPLLEACRRGYDQIIRILLDAGADATWRNLDEFSAMREACRNGHLSTVQLLINHDNGLLEIVDRFGETPLSEAVFQQHASIVRFLLNSGANPNCADSEGQTALIYACQEGSNLEIVRLLLAAGVDVEARNENQQTALHQAAYSNAIEAMRELVLQHNANMFVVDEDGCTPFDLACGTEGRADFIDHLLETYGNKLTQDHGSLSLHELLKVAQYSFAKKKTFHPPLNPLQIILPLGKLTLKHFRTLLRTLDPELIRNRDDTGKLPLHIACQTNAPEEVLTLFLELDPSVLHIADSTGALPIHLLCSSTAATEYASVRYLVKSFCGSVAVRTNAGDYPFMVAASDSSSASLSVVYELVRAHPGLFNYWTHSC